jgi:hypothetical protein
MVTALTYISDSVHELIFILHVLKAKFSDLQILKIYSKMLVTPLKKPLTAPTDISTGMAAAVHNAPDI